jgi:ABC-2 type transport system ATP-binding protein
MEYAIDVKGLNKSFGGKRVVRDLALKVPRGQIFGFLGPNGSGKTTSIRMICGLLTADSGSGTCLGYDVMKQSAEIKREVGYMTQRFSLWEDLTIRENLRFVGRMYAIDRRGERVEAALEALGLAARANQLAGELSGGWKQRLALGCAMLHHPGIVFLDEPTGGTDPISRRLFWDVINDLAEAGTTVLVTTHYLDEAEYCNELVLMHAGRIVARGSPGALKREVIRGAVYEVECPDPVAGIAALRAVPVVRETAIFGTRLHVSLDQEQDIDRVLGALKDAGLAVSAHGRIVPSLEDVFISVIDRAGGEQG